MARRGEKKRPKGNIRKRGNSLQVSVYAGMDPLTGRRLYLRDSATDEKEAERILNRLVAQVEEKRHAKTRGALSVALEEWLKTTELAYTTRQTYEMYIRRYINPAFGDEPVGKMDALLVERFYADLRRCRDRCDGRPFVEHRIDGPHDCRETKHKRPPGRRPAGGYPQHSCEAAGCKVFECKPHQCRPLEPASIVKIHHILSGTFAAAMRWKWIDSNPAEVARQPKQPPPQPKPPTAEEAGQIAMAAWEEDEMWGTLVWLVMVTGLRRAELLALRWTDIDHHLGVIDVRRAYVRDDGTPSEKPTKTHRLRRIAIDPATAEVLVEHRERYETTMRALGDVARKDAFLFSYEPTFDKPCSPDGITHRYQRMCEKLGIDSHLHALRHYSATELLTAGVDLRTVAGRLGHGGGGATTLRVYAAWMNEADRRAADILGGRMKRPGRASGESSAVDI